MADLAAATALKAQGNSYFKEKKLSDALEAYSGALEQLEQCTSSSASIEVRLAIDAMEQQFSY